MAKTYRSEKEFIIDDRYEVVEGKYRGANGELYRVNDLVDEKEYYAKQLIVQKNQVQLSTSEIREKLKHVKKNGPPVIVSILDFDVIERGQDIIVWTVTDISPLQTLANYIDFTIDDTDVILCERQSSTSIHQVLTNLCDALGSLHKKQIIHGNLKPQNIFIQDDGRIQFSDINILNLSARICDKDYMGYIARSQLWCAPELFHQESALSEAADLFSIGVMLYQMMSGKYPFQLTDDDAIQKVIQQIADTSTEFKEIPNIVNALKQILKKILAKSPDRRYRTVQSFKNELVNVSFTKYCPAKHPNEYYEAICKKCELRFDEAVVVHDWKSIKDWLSFVPVNDVIKPQQSKTLRLMIKPAYLTDKDDRIKLGKSIQIELAPKITPLNIRLLPEPQLDIVLKDRNIVYDQALKDIPINLELSILRSEAVIEKLEVSINGDLIDPSRLKAKSFLKKHILPDESPYNFQVLLDMARINKGDTVRFRFDVFIKNRNPEKPILIDEFSTNHSLSLPVIHPAKLKILEYKNPIQVFKNSNEIFQIFDVTNTGGENLRMIEIQAISLIGRYDISNVETKELLTTDVFELETFDIPELLPGKNQSFRCKIFPQSFIMSKVNKYLLKLSFLYEIFEAGEWLNKYENCQLSLDVTDIRDGYLLAVDFGTTNTLCAAVWNKQDSSKISWNTASTVNENLVHLDKIADRTETSIIPSTIEYLFDMDEEDYSIGTMPYIHYLQGKPNAFRSFKRELSNILKTYELKKGNDFNKVYAEKLTLDYLSLLRVKIEEISGYNFENYIFSHPSKLSLKKRNAYNSIIQKMLPDGAEFIFIDEATAGALFFIQQKIIEKNHNYRLIVYDFGGGTIDVTYLLITTHLSMIEVEILDVDGLPDYGGDNISDAIEDILVTNLESDPGYHLIYENNKWSKIFSTEAGRNKQRMYSACENCKPRFGKEPEFNLKGPKLYYYNELNDKIEEKNESIMIRISDVNKKIYSKIDESVNCIANLIERTSLDITDLPCYLYISGQSSQFPLVKEIFDAYKDCKRPVYNESTNKIDYIVDSQASPLKFSETNFDDIQAGKGFIKPCVALGAAYYYANYLEDEDNRQIVVKGLGQRNRTRFGTKKMDYIHRKELFVEWIPKNKEFVKESRLEDLNQSNIMPDDACILRDYTFNFSNDRLRNSISIYEHMGQGNDYSDKNCELIGQFTFDQPSGTVNKIKGKLLLVMTDQYEAVLKAQIGNEWIFAKKL